MKKIVGPDTAPFPFQLDADICNNLRLLDFSSYPPVFCSTFTGTSYENESWRL